MRPHKMRCLVEHAGGLLDWAQVWLLVWYGFALFGGDLVLAARTEDALRPRGGYIPSASPSTESPLSQRGLYGTMNFFYEELSIHKIGQSCLYWPPY